MKVYIEKNNVQVELIGFRKKMATLLTLQTLKWAYTLATDVLIASAMSRHYSVLRRLAHRTFWGMTTSVRNGGPSANSALKFVTIHFVYNCLGWLANASERTASIFKTGHIKF